MQRMGVPVLGWMYHSLAHRLRKAPLRHDKVDVQSLKGSCEAIEQQSESIVTKWQEHWAAIKWTFDSISAYDWSMIFLATYNTIHGILLPHLHELSSKIKSPETSAKHPDASDASFYFVKYLKLCVFSMGCVLLWTNAFVSRSTFYNIKCI